MPRQHDWDLVKTEYVEGKADAEGNVRFPTLHDLATKHSISESTIRKKSAMEDWPNERNIFRSRLEQRRREKKTELLAGKASEFDATIFRAAELGLQHIMRHLIIGSEALRASEGKQPMNMSSLEALGKSLVRYQQVGRLALGEPTGINSGEAADGEKYFLIQDLISDPAIAERIEANFRSRVGEGTSPKDV